VVIVIDDVDRLTAPWTHHDDSDRSFHEGYLSTIPEEMRGRIRVMLGRLFPKLEAVWGDTHWDAQWLASWRRNKRVCAPEFLPIYFRLELPAGAIKSGDIKLSMEAAASRSSFAALLRSLANEKGSEGTKVRSLLTRLEDYTESDIPEQNAPRDSTRSVTARCASAATHRGRLPIAARVELSRL
jgi:predicted KAP-like P-loop ATPase